MKLMTKELEKEFEKYPLGSQDGLLGQAKVIAKFFNPMGVGTWFITEAEKYPGPSLILAYSPCINQGIKSGMQMAQEEEKLAVQSGYFHLFRYKPAVEEGEEPEFILDSKKPTGDFFEFLNGEVRFNALTRVNPVRARILFEQAKKDAEAKYEKLEKMAGK